MNSFALDQSKDVGLLATKRDFKFLANDVPTSIQYEPAVILDIILDDQHPEIVNRGHFVDSSQWQENYIGKQTTDKDVDFTWIGRVKIRLLNSQLGLPKEGLPWAMPLENNVSEYPLVNEIVGVMRYQGNLYYTRKINYRNFINNNADVGFELTYGAGMGNREEIDEQR